MKALPCWLLAIVILITAACNNNKQDNQHDHNNHNHDSMNHDKMPMDSMKDMKHDTMSGMNHNNHNSSMTGMSENDNTMKPGFAGLNPSVKEFLARVVNQYLNIKNDFTADNTSGVKTGAAQLSKSIKRFDKSLFTAKQKQEFDKHADEMKSELQSIVAGLNINAQRASFSMLSQDLYNLIEAFGAGQTIYRDHCPMAFDNKGATWLSETKEIRNPYLGSTMLTCGEIQETLQ